jgi:hypothetical protein
MAPARASVEGPVFLQILGVLIVAALVVFLVMSRKKSGTKSH